MYKLPQGYDKLYYEYGGKGLGKIIAKDLSLFIPNLVIPQTFCIKISEISECDNLPKIYFETNVDLVLKFSKLGDDYSSTSVRGKNTSIGLPKIKYGYNIIDCIKDALLSYNITGDVISVILDEFVKVSNGLLFLVIFDGNIMKLEISKNDKERLFYVFNNDLEIILLEKNSDLFDDKDISKEVFELMLSIHKKIYMYFGGNISINTEGFFENGNYIMIQIRPAPFEKKCHNIEIKYDGVDKERELNTSFVYGIFDIEGSPITIDESNYLSKSNNIFILDEHVRWFNPLIKARLEAGLLTVLIDTYNGFHISHDPKLLPSPGIYRERFNYISCLTQTEINGKKIRLISNGDKGKILFYN